MTSRPFASTDRHIREPIEELSRVTLLEAFDIDTGGTVPKGSSGTVVSVYGESEAFYVEFTDPCQTLLMLNRDQIEPIPEEARAHYASDPVLSRVR